MRYNYYYHQYRRVECTEVTDRLDEQLEQDATRSASINIDFYNSQQFLDHEDIKYWENWPGALIDQTMQWCLFVDWVVP
jgi:hypothetical protein